MQSNRPMLILICGPYTSGTGGDAAKIAANRERLESYALPIYERGHLPMIGEWLALPIIRTAGGTNPGDPVFDAYQYPVAHRLLERCDGVLRIPGESRGADLDIQSAQALGLPVYSHVNEIPARVTAVAPRVPAPLLSKSAPHVRIVEQRMLSDDWYVLRKITFDYRRRDGSWQRQSREVYDRGDGAVILLFNARQGTVLLTRQFRLPAFVNRSADGYLIEACAGLLDGEDAATCIKREAEEETGYRIRAPQHVFDAYMSPGSVTECLRFFVAEYQAEDRMTSGGGDLHEGEDIETLEVPLSKAVEMIDSGEILDGKTIMLLLQGHRLGLDGLSRVQDV